jgi:DNA-directed RNA polymerase specialized sigma24 family protein
MRLGTKQANELEPRVKSAARWLAARSGMEPDEAEQEIWLGICERAGRPQFLSQKPSYIVQAGVNAARNEWRKRQARTRRQVAEGEAGESVQDAGLFGRVASEDALGRLAASLRRDHLAQATAEGLMLGLKKGEIARAAGVTPPAVTGAIKRLRAALAGLERP